MTAIFSTMLGFQISSRIGNEKFMATAEAIEANIVNVRSEKHTSSSKKTHKSSTYYVYYATVEYSYNGASYRKGEFRIPSTSKNHATLTVYIDPNNPGDCRINETTSNFILSLMVFVIPACISLGSTCYAVYCIRRIKRRQLMGLA